MWKVFYSNPVIKVILYKIILCKHKHLYISLSFYCCLICFIIFYVDTNKERNLYRICILFSDPNKILFRSNNLFTETYEQKLSHIHWFLEK